MSPLEATFGLSAAIIAGLLSNALCQIVIRQGFGLDQVFERSNHSVPTPRTGGICILIALVVAVVVLSMAGLVGGPTFGLLGLTLVAGAIGAVDDFLTLPPLPKLLLLGGLSVAGAWVFGPIDAVPIPLLGWVALPELAGIAVTAFWLLSIVNVVNFMDGLNGLIGSFAILALGVAALTTSDVVWPILAAQAAILGFLFCNIFRGRVFLGDAGSLALGFLIGATPLVGGEAHSFWIMPLVLLPLIADVAWTLLRRGVRGARLMEPHREHMYQRLKAQGWSHQAVSGAVFASGMAAAMVALTLRGACQDNPSVYWMSALMIVLIWASGLFVLMRAKPKARL